MPRTGTFGGYYFDPEVFTEYMNELPTWRNEFIASGVVAENSYIMDLIGEKGNVCTMPFYKPLSVDDFTPKNNDGNTDNTPQDVPGAKKQTIMMIQRMQAWKSKDFTKELTGANPMQNVANSVNEYYQQVWEKEMLNIMDTVLGLSGMASHVYDISAVGDGKITADALLMAKQKALGDMADSANGFGMVVMNSLVYAQYQSLGLISYDKYTVTNAIQQEVTLPTINGLIVRVTDRYTSKTTVAKETSTTTYRTYILGQGAFLSAEKGNYENPYYTDYDPEAAAGTEKLYTKQGRVLHPNGFSLAADNISAESPTFAELGTAANWSVQLDPKNIKIGVMISGA